jgi:hypothetical protein
MTNIPDFIIQDMDQQESRLVELMSQRPLDIWTATQIVRHFPFSPNHDLTRVASSLMDRGLVLVQKAGPFDDTEATSGLALTALGVRIGFELARRRWSETPVWTARDPVTEEAMDGGR